MSEKAEKALQQAIDLAAKIDELDDSDLEEAEKSQAIEELREEIEECEDLVVNNEEPELAYKFARDVSHADVSRLQNVVEDRGDEGLFIRFLDIEGVDIESLCTAAARFMPDELKEFRKSLDRSDRNILDKAYIAENYSESKIVEYAEEFGLVPALIDAAREGELRPRLLKKLLNVDWNDDLAEAYITAPDIYAQDAIEFMEGHNYPPEQISEHLISRGESNLPAIVGFLESERSLAKYSPLVEFLANSEEDSLKVDLCTRATDDKYDFDALCRSITDPHQALRAYESTSNLTQDTQEYLIDLVVEYGSATDRKKAGNLQRQLQSKASPVSYNKLSKHLHELKRYLPISVKDLNKNHPRLAAALKPLIAFVDGKNLTDENVAEFEQTQDTREFPLAKGSWNGLQRSLGSAKYPQLVLKIVADAKTLEEIESEGLSRMFELFNMASKESGHPFVVNQIGWARLELDPEGVYVLVDEIQSDHFASFNHVKGRRSEREAMAKALEVTPEEVTTMAAKLVKILADFPDIASHVVTMFAQENGYEKIYWHTYEGGKRLKRNDPPKSLYTDIPKGNYFTVSEDKPFDLPEDFFSRAASVHPQVRKLLAAAKKLLS